MKRLTLTVTGLMAVLCIAPLCPAQTLGEYARAARSQDKPKQGKQPRQFDNDNLPRSDKLSVVGKDTPPANDHQNAQAQEGQPAETAATAKPAEKPEQDDKQKQGDEWKGKIADQKKKIDLLSREYDVLQREYRLRAAAMYADAGNRLRNQGAWDKEDAQYKQQIEDKKKALDDARQELDDTKEKARKAGMPAGSLD